MIWFETALVALTLGTGLIWLLDRLVLAKRRAERAGLLDPKEPVLIDYSRAFFPVLAVVLVLRSFVAEPFRIPSSSMMPSLLIGDFILVNKFAYGLRLPITNKKFIEIGAPKRGDVAVFRPPHHPDQDWIKRVIGLPGDTVELRDAVVLINGGPQSYTPLDAAATRDLAPREREAAVFAREALGHHTHAVMALPVPAAARNFGPVKVPAERYFVMGDNRDNSRDSRFFGFVARREIVGEAKGVFVSADPDRWLRPRFGRFFSALE